jgi:hypothetical protein
MRFSLTVSGLQNAHSRRSLGLSCFENAKGVGIPSICEHEKVVPTQTVIYSLLPSRAILGASRGSPVHRAWDGMRNLTGHKEEDG